MVEQLCNDAKTLDRKHPRHRYCIKAGRYGGTFAHKDFILELASWISIEFKLYVIKEFQRLKGRKQPARLEWNLQRTISKINYQVHTDGIKENLIPKEITTQQAGSVYANEG